MALKKAVLDTNILVASVITKGLSKEIVTLLIQKRFHSATCNHIVGEFVRVMHDEFPEIDESIANRFLRVFLSNCEFIDDDVLQRHLVRGAAKDDPDDDAVIACALASKSRFLVTRDKGLLEMKRFRKAKIVHPSEFLSIMNK